MTGEKGEEGRGGGIGLASTSGPPPAPAASPTPAAASRPPLRGAAAAAAARKRAATAEAAAASSSNVDKREDGEPAQGPLPPPPASAAAAPDTAAPSRARRPPPRTQKKKDSEKEGTIDGGDTKEEKGTGTRTARKGSKKGGAGTGEKTSGEDGASNDAGATATHADDNDNRGHRRHHHHHHHNNNNRHGHGHHNNGKVKYVLNAYDPPEATGGPPCRLFEAAAPSADPPSASASTSTDVRDPPPTTGTAETGGGDGCGGGGDVEMRGVAPGPPGGGRGGRFKKLLHSPEGGGSSSHFLTLHQHPQYAPPSHHGHPSAGSDDENVIIKLNVTSPPAPMASTSIFANSSAVDLSCRPPSPMEGDSSSYGAIDDPGKRGGAGAGAEGGRSSVLPLGAAASSSCASAAPPKQQQQQQQQQQPPPAAADAAPNASSSSSSPPSQPPTNLRCMRLLSEFEEKNKSGEWPASTRVHCYWCCHPFHGPPVGIPAKYVHDQFYLYGCFCSLECAAAYNFQHNGSVDERWRRYGLLNLLAMRMGRKGVVRQAPDRLALSIFGGHLDIDTFRSYCGSHGRLTLVHFPPMQAMTQQVEEINDGDLRCMRPSYIPLDQRRVSRAHANIVLRRTKPVVTGRNTLDRAINLQQAQQQQG